MTIRLPRGMGSPVAGRTLGACPSRARGAPMRSSCGAVRSRSRSTPRPFELTVRRAERRLIRSLGAWVADGTVHDHFIQLTEGVVAREELAPAERALSAVVRARSADGLTLALELQRGPARAPGGAHSAADRVTLELEPTASRCGSRSTGAGARTSASSASAPGTARSSTRRAGTSSSAPTGATPAPTARPSCSPSGGIPQGDCAPVPWLRLQPRLRGVGRARRPTGSGSTWPASG